MTWRLLQLADSAFPSGGFAHSGGIEAGAQLGAIRSRADLARFLREALWNAGSAALPFTSAAHADPGALARLDLLCDAATAAPVANRASRAQGQALWRAAEEAFVEVEPLAARVRADRLPGHLAPALGAVARTLGIGLEDTQRLFLFQSLRGMAAAAVRLGLAGPLEAQALLARSAPLADEVLAACAPLRPEEAAQTMPLLDVLQGQHDRLYSKIFRS